MRTSPDFYKQANGSIVAFAQDVEPVGKLIFGYDYNDQKWITEGREEVEQYLKKNKIKIIMKGMNNENN